MADAVSQNLVNATLEQRIKAALSSDATVDDLASLIVETAAVSFDRRLSADWWRSRGRPCHAGVTGAGLQSGRPRRSKNRGLR